MRKLISLLLALVMVMGLATVAFAADNQDASFSKTYKITNEGTTNPEETFTFTYEAYQVTDSNENLQVSNMPKIADSTVTFKEGEATTAGLKKTVAVALADVKWPGVGIYYYYVKETAGSTAGVTYDDTTAYLKVTVAYDQGTDTYYTAFATLSLADDNKDGITDTKIAGFENEYTAGKLTVSKNVSGNMADQSAYFEVDITLTGDSNTTYLESYKVTSSDAAAGNATTIKIGEKTTFKLKHGERIEIANLPNNVTYTVVEHDYTAEADGAYQAATYSLNGGEATTTSISEEELDQASESVVITNTKSAGVDTGITLDSIPFVIMMVVCAAAAVLFVIKRRSVEF